MKLFQRNALGSGRDVLFRPTVQAQSIPASESNIGRLLGNILQGVRRPEDDEIVTLRIIWPNFLDADISSTTGRGARLH